MADIAHVVVLMLENRSFDCMLGRLYPGNPAFDGLTGAESNKWNAQNVGVWSSAEMTPEAVCIPTPDPLELFADMTEQIFGAGNAPPTAPTMGGFAANYMKDSSNEARAVMHGFTPEHLPVPARRYLSLLSGWPISWRPPTSPRHSRPCKTLPAPVCGNLQLRC